MTDRQNAGALQALKLAVVEPMTLASVFLLSVLGAGYLVIGLQTSGVGLLMMAFGIVLGRYMGVTDFA